MKRLSFVLFSLIAVSLLINPTAYAIDLTLNDVAAQVFFSPNGGCTEAIIKVLGGARSEILIQAYFFTSKEISVAIVKAKKKRHPC